MEAQAFEKMLAVIPQALIATILTGLLTFLYKTLKYLVERTYNEMNEQNLDVKKKLDSIVAKMELVERDTYEIKMQLNSFVTVEKHYAYSKGVNKDVSEMRERVARIEGRTP